MAQVCEVIRFPITTKNQNQVAAIATRVADSFADGLPNPRLVRLLITKLTPYTRESVVTRMAKDLFYRLAIISIDEGVMEAKKVLSVTTNAITARAVADAEFRAATYIGKINVRKATAKRMLSIVRVFLNSFPDTSKMSAREFHSQFEEDVDDRYAIKLLLENNILERFDRPGKHPEYSLTEQFVPVS